MTKCLKRRAESTRNQPQYGSFDIETVGLAGAILGVGWQVEGEAEPTIDPSPEEFCRAVYSDRYRGVVWYGHNAGNFDLQHLRPYLKAESIRRYGRFGAKYLTRGQSRIIGMTITRPNIQDIEFRDSYALLPTNLSDLGKAFSTVQKLKGTIDFEAGEIFEYSNPLHLDYLRNDVTTLLEGMLNIRAMIAHDFGAKLRITTASTAMAVFKGHIPEGIRLYQLDDEVEEYARKAYAGGLVFLRDTKPWQDVVTLDVNSLYPFVMRENQFPVGSVHRSTNYQPLKLGIWNCRVRCLDDNRIPIIHRRDRGWNSWPVGEFTTYLTGVEIEYAKNQGYDIEVMGGIYWTDRAPLFTEFVRTLETLKTKNPGTAKAILAKLLLNSLYGKFGANRNIENLVEVATVDEYINMPASARPMIGADGEMVDGVYLIPEILNAAYVQPQIAAYVTAYARVYYHKLMMRIGQDNIVYGDTDSIVCRADSELPFGMLHPTAFGALKREVSWATFQASAPKTYRGVTIDGTAVFKAKGMPARLRAELKGDEQTVSWEYLPSFRTRLKTGQPLEMVKATRSLPMAVNPRRWRTLGDGTVRPILIFDDELESEARILEDDRYIRHSHFESLRLLRRSILQHGGIRADYDYPRDSIPRGVYRKAGLPLDIMAGEVGFESADELLGALE